MVVSKDNNIFDMDCLHRIVMYDGKVLNYPATPEKCYSAGLCDYKGLAYKLNNACMPYLGRNIAIYETWDNVSGHTIGEVGKVDSKDVIVQFKLPSFLGSAENNEDVYKLTFGKDIYYLFITANRTTNDLVSVQLKKEDNNQTLISGWSSRYSSIYFKKPDNDDCSYFALGFHLRKYAIEDNYTYQLCISINGDVGYQDKCLFNYAYVRVHDFNIQTLSKMYISPYKLTNYSKIVDLIIIH